MILIVDNTQRKMRREIREYMLSRSIPCCVCDTDNADLYLPAGAVIVTEAYILSDVRYICGMNGNSPVLLCDDGNDIYKFTDDVFGEYCLKRCNGKDSVRAFFENDRLIFRSKEIYLTKTQKRIVRMLLFADDWQTGEKISAYTLKKGRSDEQSVAVHICNINRNTRAVTGAELIECRRFSGYRITDK